MSNNLYPTLPGLSIENEWVPEFSTKILTAVSKKEYRSQLAASPVYQVVLSYNFMREGRGDLRQLVGFYLARGGAFDNFLFEHPSDNSVTDQLIGVADGSTGQFQLLRSFGSEFAEPVMNIHTVSAVKVDGVTKSNGTDYTVSSTGLVTFAVNPSSGNVTWSGSYYYRARFLLDTLEFKKFLHDLWSLGKVELRASLGRKI